MKKILNLLQKYLCVGISIIFLASCSKEKFNIPNNAINNQNTTAKLTTSPNTNMPPQHIIDPKVDFDFITNGLNVDFINKSTGGSNYVISDMSFEFGDKEVFSWNAEADKTTCPEQVSHTYTRIPFIGYRVTLIITLQDNITGMDVNTLSVSRLVPVHGPSPSIH